MESPFNNDETAIKKQERLERLRENLEILREQQRFTDAIWGGVLAAIACAILWAVITIAIEQQFAVMAIGVGFAVGLSVRYFGRGLEKRFAILGAVLSVLSSLGGNMLGMVGLYAKEESLNFFFLLSQVELFELLKVYGEVTDFFDIIFIILAFYVGYRSSTVKVSLELLQKIDANALASNVAQRRRKTSILIIGSLIVIATVYSSRYFSSGLMRYEYESGAKLGEGYLSDGVPHGEWIYWYENGAIQCRFSFNNGRLDSMCTWYYEGGNIAKQIEYKIGLEHGKTTHYHENGIRSSEGYFVNGRKEGEWIEWHENGVKSVECTYKRDLLHNSFVSWYENGNKISEGGFEGGDKVGFWRNWYENGILQEEMSVSSDTIYIKSCWDTTGNILVRDGTGSYISYHDNGTISEKGLVENGLRVGIWQSWYDDGSRMWECLYENNAMTMISFWDQAGSKRIEDGTGPYILLHDNGKKAIEGEYRNGHEEGKWIAYFDDGQKRSITHFSHGSLHGEQIHWHINGNIAVQGSFDNGKRTGECIWYHENGEISSRVYFKNDQKEGLQSFWDEFNNLTKEEYYENGVLVDEKIL